MMQDTIVKLHDPWFLFSIAAQTMFMARFWVQWLHSERKGRSVVPDAFWLFSLGGGFLLTIYLLHRQEWALFVGQASGLFIYIRNLYLIRRDRHSRNADTVVAEARALADDLHNEIRKLKDIHDRPLAVDETLERLRSLLSPTEIEAT